ncbi:MAG: molecular chaperone HtpG [Mollicutes bacterium]|nr:molecular chaperone HtpG [Mollicutes bacterium]
MKKKEFKSSSKRVLDLMINSIYTNKEIFLRELISNASDAMDKLSYEALTNKNIEIKDLNIFIDVDKDKRTLTIKDHGIGMNEKELDDNLGTIAESGSLHFKEENEGLKDTNIIGQFGVGFYSAFMIAKKVEVLTRRFDEKTGYLWSSEGVDGYTIEKCDKKDVGSIITIYLKDDTEDENYSDFLEEYRIKQLVKKYSDYIRYPIQIEVENSRLKEGSKDEYETVKEIETINSMVPLWKKHKKDIKQEEYDNFYTSKFYDYEKPLKVIHNNVEGLVSYRSLLFIPSHVSFDYYYKDYKKGLELYTNGVLIMDKCEKLLPDYYNFIKGVVDTDDLSLNISRETLQSDKRVLNIAKSLESKIHSVLVDMQKNEFDKYKEFFKNFGGPIKYGVYNNYGENKDKLKDLLIFYSSKEQDFITLDAYVFKMNKKDEYIYYGCGETIEKIESLPQMDQMKEKGLDVLLLTDYLDEFTLQILGEYNGKKFMNISDSSLSFEDEKDKKKIEKLNVDYKEMFKEMKKALPKEIADIRFTSKLTKHPVCLTTEGQISTQMQKVLNAMPQAGDVNAKVILEINNKHSIAKKIKSLYENDKKTLKKITEVLYAQARLIEGLSVENPTKISSIICDLISK